MARLDKLPSRYIIDGLKGTIDFYLWKGIAVARRWPRYFTRTPTPTEATNQRDFAYVNRTYSTLPITIIDALKEHARGTTQTAKDYLVRAYLKGLFELMPPPYFATEATQLLIHALLEIIRDFAHQDNTLFGFYDRWFENLDQDMTGASQNIDSTTVPPGEVWILELCSIRNSDGAATDFQILPRHAPDDGPFLTRSLAQPQFIPVIVRGPITLEQGDVIRFIVGAGAAGETLLIRLWGYKMKIPT